MRKLYIVGAGGFGREVLWLVQRINERQMLWDVAGFIDDNEKLHGTVKNGCPIVGGRDYLRSIAEDIWVVVAIGTPGVKKRIVETLTAFPNVRSATLVDPTAIVSSSVSIGEGSIVCAGSIVTVDVKIGDHVTINLDCTVGHDVVIQDYSTIYPGVHISGNVTVGRCVELGTGSQIIQGKKIGDSIVVGAGSVVIKNILGAGTYVGVPARRVK